jgi:hypothetical protein
MKGKVKKGQVNFPVIILSILLFIALIILIAFIFFGPYDYTSIYLKRSLSGEVKNPVISDLTDKPLTEENISEMSNVEFSNLSIESITYLLIFIKAYNLHNPPLSSDTPKIQFFIGNDTYYSEIIAGEIHTKTGQIKNPDVTFRTPKNEMIKILLDNSYITESIKSQKTIFELNANKIVLFMKGYKELYERVTKLSLE